MPINTITKTLQTRSGPAPPRRATPRGIMELQSSPRPRAAFLIIRRQPRRPEYRFSPSRANRNDRRSDPFSPSAESANGRGFLGRGGGFKGTEPASPTRGRFLQLAVAPDSEKTRASAGVSAAFAWERPRRRIRRGKFTARNGSAKFDGGEGGGEEEEEVET